MSCGNSSRLKRRRKTPTAVRRGSSDVANTGPVSFSASSVHGAELVHLERLSIHAHALLAEEDRPASALQLDEERHDREERQDEGEEQQGHGAESEVHHALHHAVPAPERDLVQADDRDPVEVLEGGLDRGVLDQVGNDLDVDALVAYALDEAQQLRVLLEGQRRRRAGRPCGRWPPPWPGPACPGPAGPRGRCPRPRRRGSRRRGSRARGGP